MQPVLCLDSNWSSFRQPFEFQGALVASAPQLVERISASDLLPGDVVTRVARRLETAVPARRAAAS